jgi:hypothetical protein
MPVTLPGDVGHGYIFYACLPLKNTKMIKQMRFYAQLLPGTENA